MDDDDDDPGQIMIVVVVCCHVSVCGVRRPRPLSTVSVVLSVGVVVCRRVSVVCVSGLWSA